MSGPVMVPARCAGRAVDVPVKPSPPDHRRVACPTCGRAAGLECADLSAPGLALWPGHKARQAAERRRFGGSA